MVALNPMESGRSSYGLDFAKYPRSTASMAFLIFSVMITLFSRFHVLSTETINRTVEILNQLRVGPTTRLPSHSRE